MHLRKLFSFVPILFLLLAVQPAALEAQEASGQKPFTTEQLDQVLAPIALYPDDLLSNVLMASTYPLEVVQAARWRKEPANAKLKGDALTKALEAKDWDPSVKALTLTPDVLQTMSDKLDWTQKLGDAFLAQQDEVFDRIQFLRKKADQSGNLKSNKQQKVTKEASYIVIEPAQPNVVYVPVYQPTVVYGAWWYPAYPPYYWYGGHPASSFVNGFFWGAGLALADSLWGWGRCDWGRHDIHIDVNRYNNINVNRTQITSNSWNHDPKHRGSVPYRDQASRDKFGKLDKTKDRRDDFRGYDKKQVKDKLQEGGADKVKDRLDKGGADKVKDRLGEGGADKVKDRLDKGGADKVKDRLDKGGIDQAKDKIDRGAASKIKDKAGGGKARDLPSKSSTRDVDRSASKALDVRPKADVKRSVDRGSASRRSADMHRGGDGPKVGGGGGGKLKAGGGGGRAGGGRRR